MLKGRCLCGAVRLQVTGAIEHQPETCHCSMCRKQSGHYLAAVNVRRSALIVEGAESISWYQSSEKVERGFCSVCGSTLFWRPIMDNYEFTAVAMGLLDTPTGLTLKKHAFSKDRGDYYQICDGLPQSDSY
jgi:hypothetical protein